MQALVIHSAGDLRVETVATPAIEAGQARIRVRKGGICGSDLHAAKHAHRMVAVAKRTPGRVPMDLTRDIVFGHEFCCEVLDYGPHTARTLKTGTRVCAMPMMLMFEW